MIRRNEYEMNKTGMRGIGQPRLSRWHRSMRAGATDQVICASAHDPMSSDMSGFTKTTQGDVCRLYTWLTCKVNFRMKPRVEDQRKVKKVLKYRLPYTTTCRRWANSRSVYGDINGRNGLYDNILVTWSVQALSATNKLVIIQNTHTARKLY